jgi:hypothetical protein
MLPPAGHGAGTGVGKCELAGRAGFLFGRGLFRLCDCFGHDLLVFGAGEFWLASGESGPHPSPLPCFLEVLILRDFKSFEPEVLILIDFKSLFPEVLILEDFMPFIISELREIEKFSELLILHGLSGTNCTNGWNFRLRERFGATGSERDMCDSPTARRRLRRGVRASSECGRDGKLLRDRAMEVRSSALIQR